MSRLAELIDRLVGALAPQPVPIPIPVRDRPASPPARR